MEIARLVAMANQIAGFFEPLPERDKAVKSVAQHLKNFWDPRMRNQLAAYVMQGADRELKPLAREAVLMLCAQGQDKSTL
jgi:formate dehydrogenase subunit delta